MNLHINASGKNTMIIIETSSQHFGIMTFTSPAHCQLYCVLSDAMCRQFPHWQNKQKIIHFHIPLDIGILRYNITFQGLHKVFVISCSVKFLHLSLRDLSFVLQGEWNQVWLFSHWVAWELQREHGPVKNRTDETVNILCKQKRCLVNSKNMSHT